jgi:hypothetical protein
MERNESQLMKMNLIFVMNYSQQLFIQTNHEHSMELLQNNKWVLHMCTQDYSNTFLKLNRVRIYFSIYDDHVLNLIYT